MIAELTDVDLYEIRAAEPYPHDYDATVARNLTEQQTDARPPIADPLPALDAYGTIVLASPVWNVRAPMIMRTFVESVDVTSHTVLPLVTHAVSAMGRVAEEYAQLLGGAKVGEGLAVQGEQVRAARPEVAAWLGRAGLRR
ncbi:flavodoxin [Humibacillus xanthopallidus]|uniref:flavodoxin n=1 Tax=Humibacillus xanthopallidus TaxID=412689 RepID=UPI0021AB8852|nr:flavodoxin [Humibacillus xanthopallidus]